MGMINISNSSVNYLDLLDYTFLTIVERLDSEDVSWL